MSGLRFDSTVHRMFIKMPATSQSGSHMVRLITMAGARAVAGRQDVLVISCPGFGFCLTRQTVSGLKILTPDPKSNCNKEVSKLVLCM